MQAQDVMTTKVVAVAPDTPVTEIAKLLLERHVSAVPVVSDAGRLLGIVSEGDLIHELGQEGAKRSWCSTCWRRRSRGRRRISRATGGWPPT
jgi:CBS domain-containing protein